MAKRQVACFKAAIKPRICVQAIDIQFFVFLGSSKPSFFLKKEPDALPGETIVQNHMIYHQGS